MIAVSVFLELGLVGLKIADHADHCRVGRRNLEHPEVVFDPWTGFDMNRPHYTRGRYRAVGGRKRWLRVPRIAEVGRPLRPCLVEQMDVGIDYRNNWCLSVDGVCRSRA